MLNIIKMVGNVASIGGSFAVGMTYTLPGYMAFMVGSACWLYAGFVNRDKHLLILNGFFLAANVIGLYNAIPWKP